MSEKKGLVKKEPVYLNGNIFSGSEQFTWAWKMADALSRSTVVPKEYQGERGIGNCLIALEMASRMGTSPMMVMQNLYVVNGKPAWSSQYIVAMINSSKKYKTELQYEIWMDEDNGMSCYAYAEDHDGRIVKGPMISMKMAEDEGWSTKNGSKWKTMPEVMIRYRAASFFGRLNCPDMIMGIYTADEVVEIGDRWTEAEVMDAQLMVEDEISEQANQLPIDIDIDEETGELLEKENATEEQEKEVTQTALEEKKGPSF